jgi:hypothetical protein
LQIATWPRSRRSTPRVARLDNRGQIEFSPDEHRHLDHGYAVTSHSSQGLTAERVLVHADTKVHPDLLNSRFGYVSISRASHEATLFTDDMTKLGPQLGADVSKTSALEINTAPSIAQGIGLGIWNWQLFNEHSACWHSLWHNALDTLWTTCDTM